MEDIIWTKAFLSFLLCTDSLNDVFTLLGFHVDVHKNLTANAMQNEIQTLSKKNFLEDDALVSGWES